MDMSDHFGLEEGELAKMGIPPKDQLETAKMFLPSDEYRRGRTEHLDQPVTSVGLLHYIDNASPAFMFGQPKSHMKIAKAVFDKLSSSGKVNVFQYIEMIEEDDDE